MKKVIYLDGNRFEYSTLEELQKQARKYIIQIGDGCEIGQGCTIGKCSRIYEGCKIGSDSQIGSFCNIEEGCVISANVVVSTSAKIHAKTIIKKTILLIGFYKYESAAWIDLNTNKKFIQLGCYTRTVSEWEEDFWNNPIEFPNDGSDKSLARLKTYELLKNILSEIS